MISFNVLNEDNKSEVISSLSQNEQVLSELRELVSGMDLSDPDVEFALSYCHGSALVRVFDMGRYSFLYPFAIENDADTRIALDEIAEYAMREEVRLVVDDVPRECICDFLSFRHIDVDARDPECESFRVTVKTECELMGSVPDVEAGRVELNAISEADITEYARLCKDENVNKCWGYDYTKDAIDPDDEYFYESAMAELASGIAVSMAIRCDKKFVGEAVIYAFDGRGSAEFAIRLLPEWQGKGIGTETVRATCAAAMDIGLTKLTSRIMRENVASIRMLSKITNECYEDGDEIVFLIDLFA